MGTIHKKPIKTTTHINILIYIPIRFKIIRIFISTNTIVAIFQTYFSQCHALLKRDGLLGLQYIACPDQRYDSFRRGVDWIQKHIFPGSLLPSTGRINQALNRTGDLGLFHLEDFGASYAETLRQWRGRFESNWNSIRALGFDDARVARLRAEGVV